MLTWIKLFDDKFYLPVHIRLIIFDEAPQNGLHFLAMEINFSLSNRDQISMLHQTVKLLVLMWSQKQVWQHVGAI